MTIKEIENLSGMTRANIRFYENRRAAPAGKEFQRLPELF